MELLVERIQPRWLEEQSALQMYRLIVGLIVGPMLGLIVGPIFLDLSEANGGPIWGLMVGLIIGPILGLSNGAIFGLEGGLENIEPVEAFKISMSHEVRREILKSLRKWINIGLVIGLVVGLFFQLMSGPILGLFSGLIFGLFFGLIFGLFFGLRKELQMRSRPNQGIHNSLQSLIWTTILSYPIGILVVMLAPAGKSAIALLTVGVWRDLPKILIGLIPYFLIPGVFGALFLGFLVGGGLAVVQHYCLRFVLWQRGIAPWNLSQFLDYCVERRLL